MSTRNTSGTHYENHHRAAELEDLAAHTHLVAEQKDDAEHLTAHEHSRLEHEHSHDPAHHLSEPTVGHGVTAFGHAEIAALAYELWQERGCPEGSPDEDWAHAVKELRSRNIPKSRTAVS